MNYFVNDFSVMLIYFVFLLLVEFVIAFYMLENVNKYLIKVKID